MQRLALRTATLLTVGCLAASIAHADVSLPWINAAPFSLPAKDILASAAKIPAAQASTHEVLFEHTSYQFDELGRRKRVRYRVWRLTHPAGVQHLGMLQATWAPWYQRKPVLEARVISATGEEHRFNPALVAEETPSSGNSHTLTNRKMLRGPLPALAVGSLVEELIVLEDERPAFAAGITERIALADAALVQRLVVTIEAPPTLPLKCALRGGNYKLAQSAPPGLVRYQLEAGPLEPIRELEPFQPMNPLPWPTLWISWGESWKAVAAHYAAIVAKQLSEPALQSLVNETLTGREDREETICRLVIRLQELVRYTSVAFGDSPNNPNPPADTLNRRFGDCKDQSAALVALLRLANIPAHLALVRVGALDDVDSAFPGFGLFDHCIVYVPGDRPLWIDPTYNLGHPLSLVPREQGRLALIISENTAGLIPTPVPQASENYSTLRRELRLERLGWGSMVEVADYGGALEAEQRARQLSLGPDAIRRFVEQTAEKQVLSKKLNIVRFDMGDPANRLKRLHSEIEMADAPLAISTGSELTLNIDLADLLSRLSAAIVSGPTGSPTAGVYRPRKTPLYFSEPHLRRVTWRIVPPTGMHLKQALPPLQLQWGPARLTTESHETLDGAFDLRAEFDTGDGRFLPDDVEALRRDLGKAGQATTARSLKLTVKFELSAARLAADRKWSEAIHGYRGLLAGEPGDALLRSLYIETLLKAGLGEDARREARQLADAAPNSGLAHFSLGWTLSHDLIGRQLQPGADLDQAQIAFRRSAELDSKPATWLHLATVLERDRFGNREGDVNRLRKAIDAYRQALKLQNTDAVRGNLCSALLTAGDYAELSAEIDKITSQTLRRSFLAVTTALTENSAAVLKLIDSWSLPPNERRNVLLGAVNDLDRLRHYRTAIQLLETPGAIPIGERTLRLSLDRLKRQKRWEEVQSPHDTPLRFVQDILAEICVGGINDSLGQRYADAACQKDASLTRIETALRPSASMRQQFTSQRRLDSLALLSYQMEGSADIGFRITLNGSLLQNQAAHLFLVRREAGYRLVFAGNAQNPELGRAALEFAQAGQHDAARQWLSWARDANQDSTATKTTTPAKATTTTPFVSLSKRLTDAEPQAAELLAATLYSSADDNPSLAISTLEGFLAAGLFDRFKSSIKSALFAAQLKTNRFDDALRTLQDDDLSTRPLLTIKRLEIQVLLRQGNLESAQQRVAKLLEQDPDDTDMISLAIQVCQRAGNFLEADRLLRRGRELNSTRFLNNWGWNALFMEPLNRDTMVAAVKALVESNPVDHTKLHTLAAVQAENGDPAAIEALRLAVESSPSRTIESSDWYVVGRIAEQCGLNSSARHAYGHVQGEPGATAYGLAQRRLRKLQTSVER